MRLSGRSEEQVELVGAYAKAQGMWRNPGDEPVFTSSLELDMDTVEASWLGQSVHKIVSHWVMCRKHSPRVMNLK